MSKVEWPLIASELTDQHREYLLEAIKDNEARPQDIHDSLRISKAQFDRYMNSDDDLRYAWFAAALHAEGGIVTDAAKRIGRARETVSRAKSKSKIVMDACSTGEERNKEYARDNITSLLRRGDDTMTRWYADRKMKDEGYGHSTELSGPDGGPIETVNYAEQSKALLHKRLEAAANKKPNPKPH